MNRHWSTFVYYYLAALIGLGFILFGALNAASGLLDAVNPRGSEDFRWESEPRFVEPVDGPRPSPSPADVREAEERAERNIRARGYRGAIEGGVAMLLGAPTFAWHIRRARRAEET